MLLFGVFYASKVRKDALIIEYKYAWDDVKRLSLRNVLSNVGKDTGITVKLKLGRVRHLSAQISFPNGRTGNGSPTQASVLRQYIHQAAN